MVQKTLYLLFITFLLFSCTQFLDEDSKLQTTYTGDDGCVYCHTNSERLKVLAEEEEDTHAGGGG